MVDAKLLSDILDYLWIEYRQDSSLHYDIGTLCRRHSADPVNVANALSQEGLIKDDILTDGGTVRCAIAMKGILLVDKKFIENLIDDALAGMRGVNSIGNVMEILKMEARDFQLAFDVANEMQNRDLVKLLYAFQPGSKVNVEMTLEGVRRSRQTAQNGQTTKPL